KSLDTFDRRADFPNRLFKVSRELCIDHYPSVWQERETRERDVGSTPVTPPSPRTPRPTAPPQHRDPVAQLRHAAAALPATLRTAVLMRDIQECSYHEIARKLKLPEGTVKSRINRGRTELARQIRKLRGEQFSPTGQRRAGGVH